MNIHDLVAIAWGVSLTHALDQSGLLLELEKGRDLSDLAEERGLDDDTLRRSLDFIAEVTGLVVKQEGRYCLSDSMAEGSARQVLALYLGAYMPIIKGPIDFLARDETGLPDEAELVRAFDMSNSPGFPLAPAIVARFEPRVVLELGAGSGAFTSSVLELLPGASAIAVDRSRRMCEAITRRLSAADLSDRAKVICSDVTRMTEQLTASEIDSIDLIFAASLVNSFPSESAAIAFLTTLGQIFPDRIVVIADYYGGGSLTAGSAIPARTQLHDLVQNISGQLVPPSDLAGWRQWYVASDLELIHATKGTSEGLSWFVHVLVAKGSPRRESVHAI